MMIKRLQVKLRLITRSSNLNLINISKRALWMA